MSGDRKQDETRPTGLFTVLDDSDDPGVARSDDVVSEPTLVGVVIDTDDETPINPAVETETFPAPVKPPIPPGMGVGAYAAISVAALLLVWFGISLVEGVADLFDRHLTMGLVVLPFALAAAMFTVVWMWGEVSAWRRLVEVDRLRADLSDTHQTAAERDRFVAALRHLGATMETPHRQAVRGFLVAMEANRGADELRIIFDHDILRPMDDQALAAIQRATYDIFFLALVSPTPMTDTAAFVFRATGLIRAVAMAYGHRPGKLGLYRLLRRILADVALLSGVMIVMGRASKAAGQLVKDLSDVAAAASKTVGYPHIGVGISAVGGLAASATDVVAKEVADGITAATRMAQLGMLAVAVSRPITLNAARKTEMSAQLRTMILSLRRTAATTEQTI